MERQKKPVRSISGVTPLAVVIKPRPCPHGSCIYCPTLGVPKSYTPESPAIIRARQLNYDAYKQVKARLKILKLMKHQTDKIELIIIGGTFLAYPIQYQYNFIKRCYDAFNCKKAKTLEEAKTINENAKHRVVALCIETRPDYAKQQHIKRMLDFGTTRVELGVQTIYNNIYRLINRGHTLKEVIEATRLLKDSGFKLGYHIMPGLPGSNIKKDIAMFKKLFNDERFRPDQLKIYPTQVIKGSILEQWYWQGKYKPYSKQELIELLTRYYALTPRYCRIMRVMREIPKQWLTAGVININLRQEVEKVIEEMQLNIKEIRYREIGHCLMKGKKPQGRLRLKITKYKASKGIEYFLEVVSDNDVLFGLLRLRFPFKPFIQELENAAIVRELHVYGKAIEIGKTANAEQIAQHKGIGKMLMKKAEEIAKQKYDKIAVISGVGVRNYYRALGYELGKWFMIKKI